MHLENENVSDFHTFRLDTLNPTSDAVIPMRLKKVTIEEISSASAYESQKRSNA